MAHGQYSLICCVVNMGDASKLFKSAKKFGVKGGTIFIGRGTVRSRLPDFFALNEERKEIVIMVTERGIASEAIRGISERMEFHKPNHGIAFLHSVSEVIGSKHVVSNSEEIIGKRSSMHKIIYTIVDKGRAEEVIQAANEAGARGGTIINARGSGSNEVQKFFGMEIEPEKEEVFILTKHGQKDPIVESIRSRLNIDEPGKGILFVLDVDEVYGLHNPD